MGGPGSGDRTGRPKRKSGAAGAREWLRKLCSDPERRALFQKALDAELREGKTDAWFKAFAQGHGNPPQALDVRTADVSPGDQLIYRATFDDGSVVPTEAAPVPEGDAE